MNEKTSIKITSLASEGYGIGYVDQKVTFVPFTAPGDEVLVDVITKKKNYNEGRLVEILSPSPDRTNPLCEHFGTCGGCKWQHLTYETQLFWKEKFTLDALQHIGKCRVETRLPVVPSPSPFYYRNKMEFSFGEEKSSKKLTLGFHLPGRFDKIFHVHTCFLQDPLHNNIRQAFYEEALRLQLEPYNRKTHEGFLRNLIIRKNRRQEWMVILVVSEKNLIKIKQLLDPIIPKFTEVISWYYIVNPKKNDAIFDLEPVLYAGKPFLEETILQIQFKIRPLSFFQVNPDQAEQLYNHVVKEVELTQPQIVYDIYTGTGTIALAIASHVKKVIGIDNAPQAIEDAKENAVNNGISNAVFILADAVKAFNSSTFDQHGYPDLVILDPPRSGLHPLIVKQLLKLKPRKIIYVSCNPATQARDVQMLSTVYKVQSIRPFDMFPQTAHVENVAVLVNNNG